MRFGWYDVIDDVSVSKALLEKVHEIGKQYHLEFVEGPVGFSNLDKVGVLVDGFDHIGTMITWYSLPHYKEHLEQLGYVKAKEYLENKFDIKNVDKAYYAKISRIIKHRFKLTSVNFKKQSKYFLMLRICLPCSIKRTLGWLLMFRFLIDKYNTLKTDTSVLSIQNLSNLFLMKMSK